MLLTARPPPDTRLSVSALPHLATDSLAALIHRCAAGDAEALHRIYLLQAARLKGVALRITASDALAEDVVHDVFIQLWHDAARFDAARAPASAWLVMLTRFRAMEAARRAGREPLTAAIPEVSDDAPDPLALAVAGAEARRLHRCLAGLSARARRAIELAFVAGLTHADIARAEKMPLGTVKSLIRRGLHDLRECLDR